MAVEAEDFEALALFLGPIAAPISTMPGDVSRRRKVELSSVWLSTLDRRLCGAFPGPDKYNASVAVAVAVASLARLCAPPLISVAAETILAPF